jgi:23S rRNA (uracil1939-C5)-methyltransferase
VDEVVIEKLVHGGQGLGTLADGRKVFVWNALPGETVRVRIIKKKRSYAEAIAEEILKASPERIDPLEDNYLATSPWQMMTFEAENRYKSAIVKELFTHEGVVIPNENMESSGKKGDLSTSRARAGFAQDDRAVVSVGSEFHYRNKMEYSFWGDDDGLHLALHQRGSHGKQIVQGSALAMPAVDDAARAALSELQRLDLRAGDLKTVIVRCNQAGEAVAALFVKPSKFPRLKLPNAVKSPVSKDSPVSSPVSALKGLRVYHSNPRSPASVPTTLLYELGDCGLRDKLLGQTFSYDVDSFFQVNLPVYTRALESIRAHCQGDPVDMYAGVGSIGLSVAEREAILVELDFRTAAMARANACDSPVFAEVVESSAEKALEYIDGSQPVIFDPPRAGLHANVVKRCLEVRPPQIIYLSCNPATHARDLALLQSAYKMTHFEIFNFFPRTPHIETLAVLRRK